MYNRRRFIQHTSQLALYSWAFHANALDRPETLATRLSSGELSDFVQAQMRLAHVPGLSLAVIDQGRLVHTAGFGFADLDAKRPMTAETLLNVASVTKTLTGTAVMQLCEQGKLDLDAGIDRFLPFVVRNPLFPDQPITARQLLTHTSSVADGPAYFASYACGDPTTVLGDWLREYLQPGGFYYEPAHNFRPWAPGGLFAYSNVGYGVLGFMVERLSGLSYTEYVKRNLFDRLNMAKSRFLLEGMPRSAHATPYEYARDGKAGDVKLIDPAWTKRPHLGESYVPHCLYSFTTAPDGLARTSAAELSHFLLAFMLGGASEGSRILETRSVAQMLSDQHVQRSKPSTTVQGLAWYFEDGIWQHSGADPGVSTFMGFRPEDGRGLVLLANADHAHTDIAKYVFS